MKRLEEEARAAKSTWQQQEKAEKSRRAELEAELQSLQLTVRGEQGAAEELRAAAQRQRAALEGELRALQVSAPIHARPLRGGGGRWGTCTWGGEARRSERRRWQMSAAHGAAPSLTVRTCTPPKESTRREHFTNCRAHGGSILLTVRGCPPSQESTRREQDAWKEQLEVLQRKEKELQVTVAARSCSGYVPRGAGACRRGLHGPQILL